MTTASSGKTILSDKAVVTLLSDESLEGRILETTVQFSQEIPNITDSNKNLFSSLKNSTTREDFDRLTKELLDIRPTQVGKLTEETRLSESVHSEAIT